MEELNEFYNELAEIQRERLLQEERERLQKQACGENIYTDFRVWCRINEQDVENPKAFGQYLKDNGIELTFWQRKFLAEEYFGYKYNYDHEKQKWNIKKQ